MAGEFESEDELREDVLENIHHCIKELKLPPLKWVKKEASIHPACFLSPGERSLRHGTFVSRVDIVVEHEDSSVSIFELKNKATGHDLLEGITQLEFYEYLISMFYKGQLNKILITDKATRIMSDYVAHKNLNIKIVEWSRQNVLFAWLKQYE